MTIFYEKYLNTISVESGGNFGYTVLVNRSARQTWKYGKENRQIMKKRIFAVLLSLCMAFSLLPATALAADGESGGATTPVNSAEELVAAVRAANDSDTITVSDEIAINAPLDVTKSITLTGGSIVASDEFKGSRLITLATADATLTLGDITLDAKQKGRVIVCTAGTLEINGATITGGKAVDSFIGGVYMTNSSELYMTSGFITGNVNGNITYTSDNYLQYASDLWIGANASGLVTGGTVGNVFVNANSYSKNNPGGFVQAGGKVTNLYAEYADDCGADIMYTGGTLENLYISTDEGNGKSEKVTPVVGMEYTGGVTDNEAVAPVAKIGETGYATLAAAIAAAKNGQTVKMLNNTEVTQEIDFSDKTITLDLNGKTITGQFKDYYSVIEAQGAAATLIVEDTSANKTGTIHSNHYGLTARDDGNITVNSGTIIGDDSAALSGNNTTGNMNFTVNGGTLTAGKGPAIYQSGQCNLTITGGTLNGGISLRMGQVNISGGTINATTGNIDSPAEYYHHSGNAWLPDALYVFGGTYDKGDETYGNSLNLNITGGTFNCSNGQGSAVAIYDLGKVTQTANINISGGKFATTTNGRNAYDVLSLTDIGVTSPKAGYGVNSGHVNSAISGGYFSSDPSKYCGKNSEGKQLTGVASNDTKYPWTVGVKGAAAAPVASSSLPASVPENASDEMKETAKELTDGAKMTSSDAIEAAVSTTANQNKITATDEHATALNAIKADADPTITKDNVKIVYQTYVDMQLSDIKSTPVTGGGSGREIYELTVELTPKYRVIATTEQVYEAQQDGGSFLVKGDGEKNDGSIVNSILVEEPQTLNLQGEYEIVIPLPQMFSAEDGQKLSVKHQKLDGTIEYYTGTVTLERSEKYLTFTTNGFSPFVISAAAAFIGDTAYPTLQEAVDNVKDNETITLAQNVATDTKVTVAKTVTFKVDTNRKDFNKDKNIVAGSNTTVQVTGDSSPYTYAFTYSRPSSSSSSSNYAITVDSAKNGSVSASAKSAAKGTTVTVTVKPASGYVLDAVTVKDANGKTVSVTKKSDTQYTFAMPAAKVTVSAAFKAAEQPAYNGYIDVAKTAWYAGAVQYVTEKGLMNGTGENTFSPNMPMTRAMMMTILARYAGADTTGGATWYEKGMNWAVEKKISDGANPEGSITREQLITMLWRYQGSPMVEGMAIREFNDAASVSAWATDAMRWAIATGVIQGSNGNLNPAGNASRAEVATMLMRFCQL